MNRSLRVSAVVRPKSPKAFLYTVIAGAVFVVTYAIASFLRPWSPKRGFGLTFGILAASVFVFEMLYPGRRPRAWPLRSAKAWLQAHIYMGALAFLAVILHSGFSLPGGAMGWALLLLSAWTTLSGLLGVWLQKWIPVVLADGLRVEVLYERIPDTIAHLTADADTIAGAGGDSLVRAYQESVRPSLQRLRPSLAYLIDVRAGRSRALDPLTNMMAFLDGDDKARAEDLRTICEDKLDIDAQYTLQGLLRVWLLLHVPTAGLLMGLLVIHVFTWLWY